MDRDAGGRSPAAATADSAATGRTSAPWPDAEATDPARLGWMVGAPPPADKLVRVADMSHFQFPRTRWTFAHIRQLLPSTQIWRGEGPPSALPRALRDDFDTVTFKPIGSAGPMSWAQSLAANYTDAICVLHRGCIVYERYFGVMAPQRVHMAMSVTKSYVGTLGAMLVHDGLLDEKAPVPSVIPELAGSAYGDARIRDVLDMRVGLVYSEDYADPNAGIWEHARAGGTFPRPAGYTGALSYFEFLRRLRKEGPHGAGFAYKTPNTDVLGWLVRRASGRTLGELIAERFWQPLGCEQDACMLVDAEGTEFAGGGLNPALRDMARFGEAMRLGGRFNGRQIVPEAVVNDIRRNGSVEAFRAGGPPTLPGGAYRSMWWLTNNEHGAYAARGIHGQAIYIDPAAEMVIARFASHPLAANVHLDPTSLPAFHALAKHLMR
jgi:CubicO group peptidase (beta-lactamase class C family)